MIPITRRMALLVTTAALLPLLIFGIVAGYTLRTTTRQSVMENHAAIAARAADAIDLYLRSSERLVRSAASDLIGTGLTRDQQRRVLFNHVDDHAGDPVAHAVRRQTVRRWPRSDLGPEPPAPLTRASRRSADHCCRSISTTTGCRGRA